MEGICWQITTAEEFFVSFFLGIDKACCLPPTVKNATALGGGVSQEEEGSMEGFFLHPV